MTQIETLDGWCFLHSHLPPGGHSLLPHVTCIFGSTYPRIPYRDSRGESIRMFRYKRTFHGAVLHLKACRGERYRSQHVAEDRTVRPAGRRNFRQLRRLPCSKYFWIVLSFDVLIFCLSSRRNFFFSGICWETM